MMRIGVSPSRWARISLRNVVMKLSRSSGVFSVAVETLIETVSVPDTVRIPLVRGGVAGVKLNGALEVLFCLGKIEIVVNQCPAERRVGLSRLLDFERFKRGRFCFSAPLLRRRKAPKAPGASAIGQASHQTSPQAYCPLVPARLEE